VTGDEADRNRHPEAEQSTAGRLFIVGTPIGNLSDLSPRAAEVLRSADAVICEDTRRTGRLLAHIGSADSAAGRSGRAALLVANEHTEVPRIAEVIDRLESGQRLALVTDAGMPTISDPGRHLIAAVIERGLAIEVVPGPTAVSAALALSGLAVDRFVFEGFLPRKGRERTERLAGLQNETRAIVLYEAPHRLGRTLADLAGVCGADRPVAVAREMTKLYEQVIRSTLSEAVLYFDQHEPRGEFVIVVAGANPADAVATDDELLAALRASVESGLSKRDAVAEVTRLTGQPKRRVYELSTAL
jgi:16S rRNA (cytidine1402-2'-O)-methyltransferase